MKKFLLCLLTVVIVLGFTNKSFTSDIPISKLDLIVHQVGYCESRNNQNVRPGDNGKAHGRFQFHKPTFNSMKKEYGKVELSINSARDQEELFRWAIEKGYGKHWTCYKSTEHLRHFTKVKTVKPYTGVGSKQYKSKTFSNKLLKLKFV
jgi:hypothetical protein